MKNCGRVAILMTTYNGGRFLEAQLDSLQRQQWPTVDLYVSDDGSQDNTLEILADWGKKWTRGRFEILKGPRSGFSENFRSLMVLCGDDADYVAFCDQDDVWHPNKLHVAIDMLRSEDAGVAGLYCARTELIDENGTSIGLSPLFRRKPHFTNAIIQSIGGGNTMIMNKAAFSVVSRSARRTDFVSHDWWCYIVITAVGGNIIYDSRPSIGYRQHDTNAIGQNATMAARMIRLRRLFDGRFHAWNERNLGALLACADLLTPASRRVVDDFAEMRASGWIRRIAAFARSGIHRQSIVETIMVGIAAALGRI